LPTRDVFSFSPLGRVETVEGISMSSLSQPAPRITLPGHQPTSRQTMGSQGNVGRARVAGFARPSGSSPLLPTSWSWCAIRRQRHSQTSQTEHGVAGATAGKADAALDNLHRNSPCSDGVQAAQALRRS
jgi:hypothetical protein